MKRKPDGNMPCARYAELVCGTKSGAGNGDRSSDVSSIQAGEIFPEFPISPQALSVTAIFEHAGAPGC
jgi:hypothetical protein